MSDQKKPEVISVDGKTLWHVRVETEYTTLVLAKTAREAERAAKDEATYNVDQHAHAVPVAWHETNPWGGTAPWTPGPHPMPDDWERGCGVEGWDREWGHLLDRITAERTPAKPEEDRE